MQQKKHGNAFAAGAAKWAEGGAEELAVVCWYGFPVFSGVFKGFLSFLEKCFFFFFLTKNIFFFFCVVCLWFCKGFLKVF